MKNELPPQSGDNSKERRELARKEVERLSKELKDKANKLADTVRGGSNPLVAIPKTQQKAVEETLTEIRAIIDTIEGINQDLGREDSDK